MYIIHLTAAVTGRGRREKILEKNIQKELQNESKKRDTSTTGSPDTAPEKLYLVKRLPALTLTFAYPHDYPSANPPEFTLSCCWLEKKHVRGFIASLS